METERIALRQQGRDRWKGLHEIAQKYLTHVKSAAQRRAQRGAAWYARNIGIQGASDSVRRSTEAQ
ncbi:MAG: hypothetical protein LAN61_05275 [Acidobacteriia bacterium]|nr:hypothetical protein [Terriglobia bacterium]